MAHLGWRWVFAAGAAPALMVILVRRYVREPEPWLKVRSTSRNADVTLGRIFAPDLRRSSIVASTVAAAMMLGVFGATIWLPTWIPELLSADQTLGASAYVSYALILANVGGLLGYLSLIWLTDAIGRRWSYFVFCAGALVMAQVVFRQTHDCTSLLALLPLCGYFAIGGFGIFAVYLPELFPTAVRGTGAGFCWNFARLLTGVAPVLSGVLVAASGSYPAAASMVALVYTLGLVAIWFGPETRGRALG